MKMVVWALAAGISASAIASAAPAQVATMAVEGTRLDIVATGESTRVPDIANVSAGVVTQAPTAGAALAENNSRMSNVLAALRRAGVAERDIQTSQINLNARYDYSDRSEPRLLGYTATNQIAIRFRDLDRAGAIIDALVGQGVNQINGPNLSVDEPEAALDEARRDAVRKARQRAEIYASAAGMQVVRIVAISESGAARPLIVNGTRMAMDQAEAAAPNLQISPGEQRLTAVVSVTFELQ